VIFTVNLRLWWRRSARLAAALSVTLKESLPAFTELRTSRPTRTLDERFFASEALWASSSTSRRPPAPAWATLTVPWTEPPRWLPGSESFVIGEPSSPSCELELELELVEVKALVGELCVVVVVVLVGWVEVEVLEEVELVLDPVDVLCVVEEVDVEDDVELVELLEVVVVVVVDAPSTTTSYFV
jgi:hypothetical protein